MDKSTIHALFLKGPFTYPFATAANARTARRAIYAERARLQREARTSPAAKAARDLKIGLKGSALVVTRGATVGRQLQARLGKPR